MSRIRHTSKSLRVRASMPLAGVDHHDGGIDRGQRAVGVLREVLVARRVEEVEDPVAYSKVMTEVTTEMPRSFSMPIQSERVDAGSSSPSPRRELDRAAEQQELFGERGLAGVRVRDDREGAAAGDRIGGLWERGSVHRSHMTANAPKFNWRRPGPMPRFDTFDAIFR
jgi:hypothetical protein